MENVSGVLLQPAGEGAGCSLHSHTLRRPCLHQAYVRLPYVHVEYRIHRFML
jgi:hypothetical protein